MIKHKADALEDKLINELVEIEEMYYRIDKVRKQKRGQLKELIKSKNYIYNDKYLIEYKAPHDNIYIDKEKLELLYPYAYEDCVYKKEIKDYITINKKI